MQLTSSPTSSCSMTTSSPADPKALSSITAFRSRSASSKDSGMSTPLPAASPLAFTTTSREAAYSPLTYATAASYSPCLKFRNAAVGRPYFSKSCLEKALDASSSAAAFDGPKQRMPAPAHASTRPSTRGISGPTNTSDTPFSVAKRTRPGMSLSFIATFVMSRSDAVPPLPGAQNTWLTRGDSRSFTAMACSRPPLPTKSTSTWADIGQHVENMAPVLRVA
mmetsp:Transcript_36435/g.96926  ORF Transcript_36435/g.96926 Transcript_36435/m.96926 type:complete len:222 (+) Transcript_36435:1482-2147(+)